MNGGFRNAVLQSLVVLIERRSSNGHDRVLGEFGAREISAFGLPSFGISVGHVFRRTSEKQMAFVATQPDIAVVTHQFPVRNWAICDFPGVSVSPHLPPINLDSSVTATCFRSSPKQTTVRLNFEFGEKTLMAISSLEFPCTLSRAKTLASVSMREGQLAANTDRSMLLFSHDDIPGRCGQGPGGCQPAAVPILSVACSLEGLCLN